ncbi:hypothetical protein J3F83DRAFT_53182 [Trichoderma novae-zelandiae]
MMFVLVSEETGNAPSCPTHKVSIGIDEIIQPTKLDASGKMLEVASQNPPQMSRDKSHDAATRSLFSPPSSTTRTQRYSVYPRPNKVKSGLHPISTDLPAPSPIGRGCCNRTQAPALSPLSSPSTLVHTGAEQTASNTSSCSGPGSETTTLQPTAPAETQPYRRCNPGEKGAPEQPSSPSNLFSCMQGWRTPVSIRQSVRASITRQLAALVD